MSTFTIELKDLKFFASHGLHAEEKIVGTTFLVDIAVTQPAAAQLVTDIDDTVDYVKVYEIVKKVMNEPTALLETCCMLIAGDVEKNFPAAKAVSLTITKLSPPINNFIGRVSVSYAKAFD